MCSISVIDANIVHADHSQNVTTYVTEPHSGQSAPVAAYGLWSELVWPSPASRLRLARGGRHEGHTRGTPGQQRVRVDRRPAPRCWPGAIGPKSGVKVERPQQGEDERP